MPAEAVEVRTTVERKHPGLPRYVVVPAEAVAPWKLEGTTVVEGTLNGHELGRRTLKRWDDERWFVELTARFCEAAGVDTGDPARLTLRRASEDLPTELSRLLEESPDARARWNALSRSRRRMLREHVASAKTSSTRERRAARALSAGEGDA